MQNSEIKEIQPAGGPVLSGAQRLELWLQVLMFFDRGRTPVKELSKRLVEADAEETNRALCYFLRTHRNLLERREFLHEGLA